MIKETWSIEYDEIEAFILSMGGLKQADGRYKYKGASIQLSKKEDKKLGPLSFPQNLIEIDGDFADAEEFHTSFKLKYLKAGG